MYLFRLLFLSFAFDTLKAVFIVQKMLRKFAIAWKVRHCTMYYAVFVNVV